MDSMGQDREFTDDQKRFVLNAVYRLRKYWEQFEEQKLIADRDALLKEKASDADEFTQEVLAAIEEQLENKV